MDKLRRLHLEFPAREPFVEIGLDGRRTGWRAVLSSQSAGHMGRETEARRQNRLALFARLSLNPDRVFGLTQVHSRIVLEIGAGAAAEFEGREGDGLVTGRSEPVLSVTAADCLPIFLFDRRGGARGLVHSGWKGTGIVLSALDLLTGRFGTAPEDIEAVIGPGIGPCCYTVSRERYDSFINEFGPAAGNVRGDQYRLDLRQANLALLEQRGVGAVTVIDNCTCCDRRLGSFRRDGKEGFHNMIALFGAW